MFISEFSPADKGIAKLAKTLGFDYADAVVCTPPYTIHRTSEIKSLIPSIH